MEQSYHSLYKSDMGIEGEGLGGGKGGGREWNNSTAFFTGLIE